MSNYKETAEWKVSKAGGHCEHIQSCQTWGMLKDY